MVDFLGFCKLILCFHDVFAREPTNGLRGTYMSLYSTQNREGGTVSTK